MKTLLTLIVAITIVAIPLRTSASDEKIERPNIVFILTDDQGYGDASIHGHPLLATPNIDRLGNEGVRLNNFYVSPSCSPTRAALLTGMHEFRVGVTHTLQPREHLFAEATTLPSLMQSAGYATGFVGKWHLGNEKGYTPSDRGFDWCSTNQQGPRKHFDPTIVRNRERKMVEGYREDIFFDEAMTFIDESQDKPFLCYLATYSPHAPLDAPEEFVAPFRDKVSEKQAKYLGMVANLDYNVGRLTDFLTDRGLDQNTIVVFMNDNGQTEGLDVYNAGMRGCKCTIWEGGSRAMSFWKWPGHWTPHTVDNLTAHLDVLPTLCDLADIEIPETLKSRLEGYSLVPLLESKTPLPWNSERILFHHVGRWPSGLAASHRYSMCGVRQGNYLLLRSHPCDDPACKDFQSQCTTLRGVRDGMETTTYTQGNAQFHWGVSATGRWSLFDSKIDPACQTDLALSKPALVLTLASEYDRWWDEVYPVMIERGGDEGDPKASSHASSRSRQHAAMSRAANEAGLRKAKSEAPETPVDAKRSLFFRMDTDSDEKVTSEEYFGWHSPTFASKDTNADNQLSAKEYAVPSAFEHADTDQNATISAAEFQEFYLRQFERLDLDHDGVLTADELKR